ncbi:MAG TPA: CatB-related O-acetyltransferase [Tianweitania sediminis]|nr:CatB-related O-acetyltransferase [Tianweitania sediminis]
MAGPNPNIKHPMAPAHKRVGFLKPIVDAQNIEIGEFTYYDDPNGPEHFVERCVLYHYPFIGDRLVIGRFCALAEGVTFIMNGANHAMSGFSTYPFNIFGHGWETGFDPATWAAENRGDTVVGHDVWIGMQAMIMPGIMIGHGAIIASRAVVVDDVAPYTVVGGNPARPIKQRFQPATAQRLLDLAWWDWPMEKISRNLDAIRGSDLTKLEAAE